ncbi:MAG: polysaccharide biosynthesis C-terminal domain-containing protein, partial [Eubacterium sp.]|nr:polysaccharide biosynthesis C-terminal domain-containing protein [Eubacterium sp.]
MDKALQKTDEMGTASLPKLIAKYSVVTFCALFFNELYNIIDTLFVSRGVGDNAMGGVSIIFPFMMIQGAISQTIGSGAATVVSKLLGKREYEKAGSVTACAMLTFYITSILITILGLILLTPLLRLFGATDDIMAYAKEYFTIILLGNVFSTGFSSIIRAEGKMVYSLLIWLIPTAVNISLDAVFIYALDMGVKGAALATVICYFTSFLMSVIFFKKISVQKFSKIKIEPKMIWEIITLGAPMLLQLGSMSILFMIINKALSASGGT